MSQGPWSDYQSASAPTPPTQSGPWDDYAPAAPARPAVRYTPDAPVNPFAGAPRKVPVDLSAMGRAPGDSPAAPPSVAAQPSADAAPDNPTAAALAGLKDRLGIHPVAPQPGLMGDAQALGAGVLSGIGGLADAASMVTPQGMVDRVVHAVTGGPPEATLTDFTNAAGGDYEPQTVGQRFAKTLGEFAPQAFLGEGGIIRRGLQTVIPAVTSQSAAEAARAAGLGPTGQKVAAFAGALAGGRVASLRKTPQIGLPKTDAAASATINKALALEPDAPIAQVRADLDAGHLPVSTHPGLGALGEALAQSPGPARVALSDALERRTAGEGGRVLASVTNGLGVNARAAAGNIKALVEANKAKANALFAPIDANDTPLWTPELEALSKRPPIRAALADVKSNALAAGEDPEALGVTFMEDPAPQGLGTPPWDGAPPVGAPIKAGPQSAAEAFDAPGPNIAAGPRMRAAPSRGPSLLQWISKNGGIGAGESDAKDLGLENWHVANPFHPKLMQEGGYGLDTWAERAKGAGYLGQTTRHTMAGAENFDTPVGPNDLLEAMRREMAGDKVYAKPADPVAEAQWANQQAEDERAHFELNAKNDAASAAQEAAFNDTLPKPTSSPVDMQQPTINTWNRLRQAMSGQVKRDEFGYPKSDTEAPGNYGVRRATQDLTDALAGTKPSPEADAYDMTRTYRRDGRDVHPHKEDPFDLKPTDDPMFGKPELVPGLRHALDTVGDDLDVRRAFDNGKGSLFNGTVADHQAAWDALKSEPERDAHRAALANDILVRSQQAQGIKPGAFKAEGVREKLRTAFGAKADPFIADMEKQAAERKANGELLNNSKTPYRLALKDAFAPTAKKKGISPTAVLDWGATAFTAPHLLPVRLLRAAAERGAAKPAEPMPWEDPATSARLGALLSDPARMGEFLDRAAGAADAHAKAISAFKQQRLTAPLLAGAMALSGQADASRTAPRKSPR